MMRAYIVTTLLGVFAVDENNKIISFESFDKNPSAVAEKMKLSEIELIEEEKKVRDKLGKGGYREFVFGYRKPGVRIVEPNNTAEKFVKENLRKVAAEKKVFKDQVEFNQFLTRVNSELTKVKIKKATSRDSLISQANNAIEELDKSLNIFVERLREWYGLHFPEMDRAISSHEKFTKLIEQFGRRENMEDEILNQFKTKSMGADFEEEDIKIIQTFAGKISELYKLRQDLSKYLEKILKVIAPNFTDIAGPMLAAKLIAKAGGLERLARMPSSTIQLLGAEKALFRYLHGKGKSPRHGIIFSHPLIQNAPDESHGKIARLLAAKLSIAAKLDFYSEEYKGDKMKKDLQDKVKEILKSG